MIKFSFYFILFLSFLLYWKFAILLLVMRAIWVRFYQVRRIPKVILQDLNQNFVLAPVHGKVLGIHQKADSCFIKIRVGFWSHKGFYAMSHAEVDSIEVHEKGKKAWSRTSIKKLSIQKKYSAMLLKFLKTNMVLTINILHSYAMIRPSTLIMPGDRVTPGAHLGWLPLGGIVMIELPLNGKLKVQRGDWIKFYNTVIMEL